MTPSAQKPTNRMLSCVKYTEALILSNRNPTRLIPNRAMWLALLAKTCLVTCLVGTTGFAASPTEDVEPQTAKTSAPEGNQAELMVRGAEIYKQTCQSCHGISGQGNEDHYDHALVGDLSIGSLTDLISQTMPEENPGACTGKDAVAVATYIHTTFYSEAARVRNRPPRISMSRLTGEQLRQSIADIYAHFTKPPTTSAQRGVKANYYNGSSRKSEELKIDRIDNVIDFDFGNDSPGEGIDAKSYLVQWKGSLKIDRTGRYQIVLRSSCSCMMEFGSRNRELINNHVQSEGRDEFRRDLFLTAGRAYPFEISFLQRKRKTKQPPALISLSWIPPGGIEEIIPRENLIPEQLSDTFALQAKLPPDDRSYGYDRGTSVSRQWDESTTETAIEFAEIAIKELYPQYRHRYRNEADENRAILKRFLAEIVKVAFRGKLDDAARNLYIDQQVALSEDDGEAIRRVMLLTLKSPRFLYPTLDTDHNRSQKAANRLALVMFDSLPTAPWLVNAAGKDQLRNDTQLANAARRMVNDYRTQAKTLAFLNEYLGLHNTDEITKDSELFPGFDSYLIQDLRKSMNLFLLDCIDSETGDFRQLLQADWCYTTKRLENYYGAGWQPETDEANSKARPAQVTPETEDEKTENATVDQDTKQTGGQSETTLNRSVRDPKIHAGILTHPLIMSNLAYHRTTSPIHRGVFLTRRTLGRVLRPPDASFTPFSAELHPELTTRERVQLQTGEVNCQVCHKQINSLGFALEHFDATGKFRNEENKKQINASGSYTDRNGKQDSFNGARELADYLATSEDCHRAFVEAAFEHFVKQPIAAYGIETADEITKSFRDSGYSIRELLITIAVTASRQPSAATTNP